MKKIILTSLAAFAMMSASAQNELSMKPFTATPGTQATATLYLKNDFKVASIGVQFDLPKGFHPVYDDDDDFCSGDSFKMLGDAKAAGFLATGVIKNVGGVEQINFGGVTTDGIAKNSAGDVAEIYLAVDSDVKPGVYPIQFKIKPKGVANSKMTNFIEGEYTTYVVVGDAKGEVAFAGTLAATVNEALASATAITKVDLSGVTAVNGTFTYVDGREVVGSESTASVKYVGNNEKYYSINVPFDAEVIGDVYKTTSVDENYAVFTSTTTVAKNTTVLAKGEVTLTATATVAGVMTDTNGAGYYVLDGTLYSGKNLTVKPMRGLFNFPSASNLRIVIDGELTGITTAEIDAQAGNTYDLQGRQSVNAKNGVFVVNGKKQFVK